MAVHPNPKPFLVQASTFPTLERGLQDPALASLLAHGWTIASSSYVQSPIEGTDKERQDLLLVLAPPPPVLHHAPAPPARSDSTVLAIAIGISLAISGVAIAVQSAL